MEDQKETVEYIVSDVSVHNNYTNLKNRYYSPLIDKLEFTPYAWVKLNCYINLVGNKEITGFGKIQDGKITDVKIINQEVEGAYVKSKDDLAIAEFLSELPMEDIEQGLWNLDWHSHVDMSVFASGTDWNNYESMLEYRGYKPYPAMVVNKAGDIWCKNILGNHDSLEIDVEVPSLSDIKQKLPLEDFDEIYKECEQDILQKCKLITKKPKPLNTYNSYNTYNTYNTYNYNTYNRNNNAWYDKQGYDPEDYEDVDYEAEEKQYCKCCGTELVDEREREIGLCEDCANYS